ncbi:MAG: glutaredoxin domain-containing protein [Candidatus Paceibacterota bacterium]
MKKIKIYSTPSCPYCNLAKDYFKDNKLEYEEINVMEDQKAAEEMVEKTGQMGVPVIIINDEDRNNEEIIIGFDRGRIAEVLGKK